MDIKRIEEYFREAIQEKAVYNKLEGYSEDKIFNWRKNRIKITRGEMIDVLWQLGIIDLIDKR